MPPRRRPGANPGGTPTSIPGLSRMRLPAGPVLRGRATALDFALIFALALALRLHGLGAKPLWIDEVVTKVRAALPFPRLLADSFSHHHLPTYFLLLAQLSPGGNPWLLRLPSAIAGALAAAIAVLVGRALAGKIGAARMGGLMSGLFLAAAPVMVQFGQDARPYAMELACLMLSLWGLVTLACDEAAAAGPWRSGLGAWSALLLGMVGALALIGDAAPFLLVASLAAWPIARGLAGAARRRFVRRWIAGQAAVLVAVAPLYVAMSLAIKGQYLVAFAWIPPLGALRAWRVGADVYLLRGANIADLHLVPTPLPALALAVPLLAAAGWFALRRQPAARWVMVLAVVALPVMLILAEPARPLWLPRYLLWSGAAFLILAGVGAAWLARRWRVAAPVAAAALLLVNLVPFYTAETAPRWDLAAAALAPSLAKGADVFVHDHGIPMMLRAYLADGDQALPDSRVLFHLSQAEARLRAGATVIAVHGPVGQELTSTTSEFRGRAGQIGTPAGETRIGREIVLIRFNPPPGATPGPLEADVRPNP
jgi:mannosyltransferase